MTHRRRATCLTMVLLSCSAPLGAQSVRISGSSNARYIELRPFLRDSVPADTAVGAGLLRQMPDGRVVRCIPGEAFCRDVRPGAVTSTTPVIHDIEISAWGFGQGLRLFSQLRGRTSLGGNRELWPRGDRALDVMALYGEMTRNRLRLRAGRQWKVSGLGFYNFDGVAAEFRPVTTASFEVYGGRSLVRGLNEARTSGALESIEPLSVPDAGLLMGIHARYRPSTRFALSGVYQVDFRGDRRALYSELAAFDGVFRSRAGSAEASVEIDAATAALNQARLQLRSRVIGQTTLFAEARRYRPYFELWTIWGAFSPVGFDEARGGLTWADRMGRLIVRGEASYRDYEDVGSSPTVDGALRSTGWGLGASASWSPAREWRVDGSYRVETGVGAARRDGLAGVRRDFGDRGSIALQGTVFQRLYEFRLDEGTVAGAGAEGTYRLNDRLRASASVTAYRHFGAMASSVDWTQRRASVRLAWVLGQEPGNGQPAGGPR